MAPDVGSSPKNELHETSLFLHLVRHRLQRRSVLLALLLVLHVVLIHVLRLLLGLLVRPGLAVILPSQHHIVHDILHNNASWPVSSLKQFT